VRSSTSDSLPPLPADTTLVRSDGRALDVVAFEVSVVDFFVKGAELLGAPRSVAAIYGIIFASPVPLSFADVEERLEISKGSISQGLRVLRSMGAIKTAEVSSDRREYFEPDMEMRKLISRFIDDRLHKQLSAGTDRLTQLKRTVPSFEADGVIEMRDRLQQLKSWHDKTRAVLPVIKTFLALSKS